MDELTMYQPKITYDELKDLCFVMEEFTQQLSKRNQYLRTALFLMVGLELLLFILMLTVLN
jgi:hypothetical protein